MPADACRQASVFRKHGAPTCKCPGHPITSRTASQKTHAAGTERPGVPTNADDAAAGGEHQPQSNTRHQAQAEQLDSWTVLAILVLLAALVLTNADDVRRGVLQAIGPVRLAQPAQGDVQWDGGDQGIVRHLQGRSASSKMVRQGEHSSQRSGSAVCTRWQASTAAALPKQKLPAILNACPPGGRRQTAQSASPCRCW